MIVPQSLASALAEPPFGCRETVIASPSPEQRGLFWEGGRVAAGLPRRLGAPKSDEGGCLEFGASHSKIPSIFQGHARRRKAIQGVSGKKRFFMFLKTKQAFKFTRRRNLGKKNPTFAVCTLASF